MLGSVQAAHRATQQLLRVDEEDPTPLKPPRERELIARMKAEIRNCDGVLISDIDKGILTPVVLRALIDGGRARGIPVIVDPRRTDDFSIYRGATALTPNRHETEVATGMRLTDRGAWRKAAESSGAQARTGGVPDNARSRRDVPGGARRQRHLRLDGAARSLRRDGRGRRGAERVRDVFDRGARLLVGGDDRKPGREYRGDAHRHRSDHARGSRARIESRARKLRAQNPFGGRTQGGARARASRRPANRFHQRMLRPAACRAHPESRVCARAGRRAGGRTQQRSQRGAAQGRRASHLSGGRARANPGRARSGRLRGGVRGNARRKNYSRGQARRSDQGRRLARQRS